MRTHKSLGADDAKSERFLACHFSGIVVCSWSELNPLSADAQSRRERRVGDCRISNRVSERRGGLARTQLLLVGVARRHFIRCDFCMCFRRCVVENSKERNEFVSYSASTQFPSLSPCHRFPLRAKFRASPRFRSLRFLLGGRKAVRSGWQGSLFQTVGGQMEFRGRFSGIPWLSTGIGSPDAGARSHCMGNLSPDYGAGSPCTGELCPGYGNGSLRSGNDSLRSGNGSLRSGNGSLSTGNDCPGLADGTFCLDLAGGNTAGKSVTLGITTF